MLPGKPAANPRIYLGAPSWNHPEWQGKVYKPGKKGREYLPEYVQQFNGIEVNATAYRMPGEAKIETWRQAAAGNDFKFCIKFPQSLTHYGSPEGKEQLVNEFLDRVAPLGSNLGPTILQFSDRFGPKHGLALHALIRNYSSAAPLAVELRHPDWFVGDNRSWLDWLQQAGQVAIITDTSGRRDVLHMRLTSTTAFVRFNGNNLHPTDFERLDAWAERCADWLRQGLQELHFYLHTAPKAFVPELVDYFRKALGGAIGKDLGQLKNPESLQ